MAHDQVVILCFRAGNPRVLVVDGASKTKCETCGHDVWIAPSSRRMRQEMKAKIVCEVCQELKAKPGEVIEVLGLNNEQKQEISDTIANLKRRN